MQQTKNSLLVFIKQHDTTQIHLFQQTNIIKPVKQNSSLVFIKQRATTQNTKTNSLVSINNLIKQQNQDIFLIITFI